MMNAYAIMYWTGVFTYVVSVLPTLALVLWFGIKVVDLMGNRLWKKLRAYHDLKVLQEELRRLEYQGKLWKKPEPPKFDIEDEDD